MARRYARKSGGGSWIGALLVIGVIIYIIKILLPILVVIGIVAAAYGIFYYGKHEAKAGVVGSSLALIFCLGVGGYLVQGHQEKGNERELEIEEVASFSQDEEQDEESTPLESASTSNQSTTTDTTSESTSMSSQATSESTSTTQQAAMDPASFLIHKPASQKMVATVSKYVDGDTTYFNVGSQMIKVRYLLIDTPELSGNQPYAAQARDRLTQILSQAQTIEVAYDIGQKQDHYGRELMYVFADGLLVQEMLAGEGLAMVRYVTPPNTKYLDQVQAAQNRAKAAHLNIWSTEGFADENGYHTAPPAQAATPTAPASTNANGETQYVDANGNGLIKGSSSGIYHIPGSRYYDKTTRPVRMFKTISEAEQVGFRAPKR